jgi:signal peptidase
MGNLKKEVVETVIPSALIVGIILLISGTYPVFAVVYSDSMVPNLERGDVVFLMKSDVISYEKGKELNYVSFGNYGDVIVYRPNGDSKRMPIIHRAMFWIEKGEIIPNDGIAPNSGFVTKGDANSAYDQPFISSPVKEKWIIGVAKFRIPKVGIIYLKILEFIRNAIALRVFV